MKIDVRDIPPEGFILSEEFTSQEWALDTEEIRFLEPLKVTVVLIKSYNAILVKVQVTSLIIKTCGRCLKEEKVCFDQQINLEYVVDNAHPIIELDPDIREEIILHYPLKVLCSTNCKGLCPKCGVNLNEGGCRCGIT